MQKDTHKTLVVFRKFKDTQDVIALFPAVINYPNGNCESYMRVGQHGAANYNGLLDDTLPTTDQEHRALR